MIDLENNNFNSDNSTTITLSSTSYAPAEPSKKKFTADNLITYSEDDKRKLMDPNYMLPIIMMTMTMLLMMI